MRSELLAPHLHTHVRPLGKNDGWLFKNQNDGIGHVKETLAGGLLDDLHGCGEEGTASNEITWFGEGGEPLGKQRLAAAAPSAAVCTFVLVAS